MKEQNFKNHSKWVIGYHLITFLAIVLLIVGSVRHIIYNSADDLYPASLLVLIAFILLLMFYYLRGFALKAQDRAIVSEEKFRYYLLTGKPLSSELTVRQIIGLRFASDNEFPALAIKAEKEQLSEKDIKKSINNWKSDSYRV